MQLVRSLDRLPRLLFLSLQSKRVVTVTFFPLYCSGALMVLTLKVISCSINYNDGLLKEGLSEAQKKNRLIKLPSLIEYVGYCLCCGSHFAGPVFEMKDYLEWTDGNGVCPFFFCFDRFTPELSERCSYVEFCHLGSFSDLEA